MADADSGLPVFPPSRILTASIATKEDAASMKIALQQHAESPEPGDFDDLDHWILLVPVPKGRRPWPALPYREVLARRWGRLAEGERRGTPFTVDLPNAAGSRVVAACMDPELAGFELLTLARKLGAEALQLRPERVGLWVAGFELQARERFAEALITALLAASAELPSFKRQPPPKPALKAIRLFGHRAAHGFARSFAEAEGNNLARQLTLLPPNDLTPGRYRTRVQGLARRHGWQMRFLDLRALRRLKAGAFLAVAQASPEPDAGIVHLRYRPARSAARPALALVGKGICFDTGGTNLKSARHMLGMHEDMEGSAVALGTLLALTRLKVAFPVDCWLALATNHIGPKAYKPNDVITALDGTSIEIVHTDAEGRMVLADTLTLASRAKPGLVLDFATLTGACVAALGKAYAGAFTNRPEWVPRLIAAGQASGERIWPFPMDEDYDKALESGIADIRQCSEDNEADHILGARFLSRFVGKDCPWVHIDLSSGNRKGGLAHIPTDITGFGVRLSLNMVLDLKLHCAASG